MLAIIISVVMVSFSVIMIFWYVTDYSIRLDPFEQFSDNDILKEEGLSISFINLLFNFNLFS